MNYAELKFSHRNILTPKQESFADRKKNWYWFCVDFAI